MIILEDSINALEEKARHHRRALHRIPELGLKEYKTYQYLMEALSSMEGVVTETVAGTGILAWIQGESKSCVAFRADIDALEVTEKSGAAFASEHSGMMHACGHDGHMTMALLLTEILAKHRNRLKKSVLVIFQPAEEGPGGAETLVGLGVLSRYHVEAIYGYHLFPQVEEGKFATRSGPLMAMTGEFDIDLYGKSAHGAMPDLGADAIVAASALIGALQSIVSRNLQPAEPAVVTVGKMSAGEMRNVLAGHARLEGTYRTFSPRVFEAIAARIKTLSEAVALGFGCEARVEIRGMYPPVINDASLVEMFVKANGRENVEEIMPQMIAEDFSYYQQAVPGLFVFVGSRNADKGFVYGLHHEKFNFDERVLLKGVMGMLKTFEESGVLI
jgi:amidohydrolase